MRQWVVRWTQGTITAIVALLCGAPAAHAGPPPPSSVWPAGDEQGVFPRNHPDAGVDVVAVGDVNGDAVDDLAIDNGDCLKIVFRDPARRDRAAVCEDGVPGFRITEPRAHSPRPVGDLNRDGLADVAVGDWVVFGKRDRDDVDGEALRLRGLHLGEAYYARQVFGLGDQNGDGIRDLAITDTAGATVIYTPAQPAGAAVSTWQMGGGYRLSTHADSGVRVYGGSLGDINGDGREDLAIAAHEGSLSGRVRVYGVHGGVPAGSDVDLRDVAAAGRGFEFRAEGAHLSGMSTIGDQNRDGKRDVAVFVGSSAWQRTWLLVRFTPPAGTVAALTPSTPLDQGYGLYPTGTRALDVGDQDGDGIADLAITDGPVSYVTPTDAQTRETSPWYSITSGLMWFNDHIADSVADSDGDGRREIIGKSYWNDPVSATYDIYYSHARAPHHFNEAGHPVYLSDGRLRSDVIYDWNGAQGDAWRPVLRVWDPQRDREWQTAGPARPAGRERFWWSVEFRVTDAFDGDGLVPGETYYWTWDMRSDDGRVGHGGGWTQFVYHPGNHPPPGTPDPEPTIETQQPGTPSDALRGTNGKDRLIGTPRRDRLSGLGGADVIQGRAANDRLDGGSGNDRIDGGTGADTIKGGTGTDRISARDGKRDVVDCGRGRDSAVVDRRDRVRGCERVRRR